MVSDADEERVGESVRRTRLDTQIVEALADATDRNPVDVPPLYESVDLDALTALVEGRDGDVNVQFEHVGCTVTVAGGTVTVEE